MEVRRLTAQEQDEADLISVIAFHWRKEDLDKIKKESLKEREEEWGAFADDGKMMARIINHKLTSWMDGSLIQNGGIGSVSTLPEYRNAGAIRAIFHRLIPEAYQHGEIISTLAPFNHAFYRKFGYETVRWRNNYAFSPSTLREYYFSGKAELWKPGDSVSEFTKLYNDFAKGFNLAIQRDDDMMLKKHLEGAYYQNRKFGYLLRENEKPVAYLIFQDVRSDSGAILDIQDLAWEGKAGLEAILGFLSRFTADYGTIRMFLPSSLDLLSIIRTPNAYDISQTAKQDYMLRVIHAQRLLEMIRKPISDRFVIRIGGDIHIPQNNGTWEVCGSSAVLTEKEPDISVSIQALGQLASGSVSLSEALYRPDVQVAGNESVLEKIFVRKPILREDHF